MISFRYHVVSLLAVLLALAVGIAVGSGPLQREDAADTGEGRLATAEARADELDRWQAFADDYAGASAPAMLGDVLGGRAVTLLLLPGSDAATADSVAEMVTEGGGSVTARVALTEELLDVGNRQLVEQLATQMGEEVADAVEVPEGASGYERMGLLLAHAVTAPEAAGSAVDDAGETVLAGMGTADLAAVQGEIDRRGRVVVAVGGAPYGTADERAGAISILTTLLTAVDSVSGGVTLLGPLAAGAEDGLVGGVRRDPTAAARISTVDVGGTVAGAVVTVLALGEEARGGSGHYGSPAAADGAVPGAAGE